VNAAPGAHDIELDRLAFRLVEDLIQLNELRDRPAVGRHDHIGGRRPARAAGEFGLTRPTGHWIHNPQSKINQRNRRLRCEPTNRRRTISVAVA